MEIVASAFGLRNKSKEQFNDWLKKIPVLLKVSEKEDLWEGCENRVGILWVERSGFILY
jgi:hypothetical protein